MREDGRLWTPDFVLLNLQFLFLTSVTALFFPFQAYLQGLGLSQETIGLVIGADALAALVVQPAAALLIRERSARIWLVAGSAIFAAALFLEGRSTTFAPLLAMRLLQGAGFGCVSSALIAMIAETIPSGMSGRAYGWTSLIRLAPYACAPLLLDAFAIAPAAFGQVLQAAAFLALAPAATAFMLRGANSSPSPTQAAPPGFSAALGSVRSRRVALILLACLMLYSGYSVTFFYVRALAFSLGVVGDGLFFTLAVSTMMLTRLIGGALFDRFDKVRLSFASFSVIAVSYAALPFAARPELFFALALSLGLGWGAAMPLQAAVMFEVSPESARGLNQNLLMTMIQTSFFIGPALAGALLSASGFTALFLVAACASLLAALATRSIQIQN